LTITTKELIEAGDVDVQRITSSRKTQCANITLRSLGNKEWLKAVILEYFISKSINSQLFKEKTKPRKAAQAEPSCRGGLISCKTVGDWFGKDEAAGSTLRRLGVDYGLLSLDHRYSPTKYSLWDLRNIAEEFMARGEKPSRLKVFCNEVWLQECSMVYAGENPVSKHVRKYYV